MTADRATRLDITEPATGRTRPVGWLTVAAGCWLMLAPQMWTYGAAGGLDARYNDVVTGLLVAAIGLIRLARGRLPAAVTVTAVTIGAWLVIAPFVLGYGFGEHATRAAISDVVIGILVAVLALQPPAAKDGAQDTAPDGAR